MDKKTSQEKDKFKAVWVSHSSISDFLKCPRLYYLHNVYKDKKTGRKMTTINPPMALGLAVHEVVESLSTLPVEERLTQSLTEKFEKVWKKVSGEKGGFVSENQEKEYYERGIAMLENIKKNPGPLRKKAIKVRAEGGLPYYWLSDEDEIILCGKIDWIEFLDDENAVNIIDFKTGKNTEDESSLQLPIYLLLATNTQKWPVKSMSYWYLDHEIGMDKKKLPDPKDAYERVYDVAKRIKLARQLEHFVCPKNGCRHCMPFEAILKGEGKKVGLSEFKQDVFILP